MAVTLIRNESAAKFNVFENTLEACNVSELSQTDEAEVLDFLSARPVHTVFMASLIRDNGMANPQNRGSFYACRDGLGRLDGVALVGHATLVEARTESSVAAFARLARNCHNSHLIRGESKTIDCFWKHYANSGQEPRLVSRELLFQQYELPAPCEAVDDLRPANLDDLDQVMKVNAAMAFQEAGVSPFNHDPSGFRQRTARRIEKDRIWIWVREGRLIFKADIVAETPQVVYLEGVHVHPEERLQGYGLRCMTQLGSILLARTESICLTINQQNKKALKFYAKGGYQFHSDYETIYLR